MRSTTKVQSQQSTDFMITSPKQRSKSKRIRRTASSKGQLSGNLGQKMINTSNELVSANPDKYRSHDNVRNEEPDTHDSGGMDTTETTVFMGTYSPKNPVS